MAGAALTGALAGSEPEVVSPVVRGGRSAEVACVGVMADATPGAIGSVDADGMVASPCGARLHSMNNKVATDSHAISRKVRVWFMVRQQAPGQTGRAQGLDQEAEDGAGGAVSKGGIVPVEACGFNVWALANNPANS